MDATNMATGKGPTPLFEVIRATDKSGAAKLSVPRWAKPGHGAAATDAADGSASEGTPAVSSRGSSEGLSSWMRNSVRVSRAVVVTAGALTLLLVVLGGWLAHRMGYESGKGEQQNYEASASSIERLREQAPVPLIPANVMGVSDRVNSGLIPRTVNTFSGPGGKTAGSTAIPSATAFTAPSATQTGATPAATAIGDDPRQPGLNYYRLTVLPESAATEAMRIVAFLGKNGVDAAVIPVQNGKALKVVALQGFSKPISDSAAKQYSERLKSLGRQWRATQKGSSDWKDMFPEKYLPSKN